MTPQQIYIAGPMSGWPGSNYPRFMDAEEHLRLLGYDVLNPARLGPDHPGASWEQYMRLTLRLVTRSDAICLLPDWEASRGARLEVHVAHGLGLKTIPIARWTRDTLGPRLNPVCMVPDCGCSGPAHP